MSCITPSHPTAIPNGESLDIDQVLQITSGNLRRDNQSMSLEAPLLAFPPDTLGAMPAVQKHRVDNDAYLAAQSATSPDEVLQSWARYRGKPSFEHVRPAPKARRTTTTKTI